MPHTPWSEEEDAALLSVVCRETSMSWSRVADLLPGRSQSSARNRYVRLTCREGEGWAVGDDFHLALLVFDDGRSLAEVSSTTRRSERCVEERVRHLLHHPTGCQLFTGSGVSRLLAAL